MRGRVSRRAKTNGTNYSPSLSGRSFSVTRFIVVIIRHWLPTGSIVDRIVNGVFAAQRYCRCIVLFLKSHNVHVFNRAFYRKYPTDRFFYSSKNRRWAINDSAAYHQRQSGDKQERQIRLLSRFLELSSSVFAVRLCNTCPVRFSRLLHVSRIAFHAGNRNFRVTPRISWLSTSRLRARETMGSDGAVSYFVALVKIRAIFILSERRATSRWARLVSGRSAFMLATLPS